VPAWVVYSLLGAENERTMDDVTSRMGKFERAQVPLWALFIALVGTLPLTNFVGHSHWEYIQ
jgi:hypothetical protein